MTTLLDTGRTWRRAGIALATGASLFAMAGAAFAVPQVQITSVNAVWGPLTGGTNVNYNPAGGGATAEVRWGSPAQGFGGQQSGYKFAGVTTPTAWLDAEADFDLGDFTHFNNPINSGTSITQAVLTLSFGVDYSLDGGATTASDNFAAQYIFNHDETPNGTEGWWGDWSNPTQCANGPNGVGVNSNGCSDNVSAILNSGQDHAFEDADGNFYYLSISGFEVGGTLFDSFWTKEQANNSATLVAQFTAKPNVIPNPNVIPLPAAVWMLLGGIGGLGAVARRRRTSAAA